MAEAIRPVLAFMALVVGCATLLAATAALTDERIRENRARRFQQTLTELTGSARLTTRVTWSPADVARLCDGRILLRGTAAGYGGDIHWLAAARTGNAAPRLQGVRITAHQETPGIADFLDAPERGWLAALRGATAPALADVDLVSGATITSRGLRRALAAALERPLPQPPECPA